MRSSSGRSCRRGSGQGGGENRAELATDRCSEEQVGFIAGGEQTGGDGSLDGRLARSTLACFVGEGTTGSDDGAAETRDSTSRLVAEVLGGSQAGSSSDENDRGLHFCD